MYLCLHVYTLFAGEAWYFLNDLMANFLKVHVMDWNIKGDSVCWWEDAEEDCSCCCYMWVVFQWHVKSFHDEIQIIKRVVYSWAFGSSIFLHLVCIFCYYYDYRILSLTCAIYHSWAFQKVVKGNILYLPSFREGWRGKITRNSTSSVVSLCICF